MVTFKVGMFTKRQNTYNLKTFVKSNKLIFLPVMTIHFDQGKPKGKNFILYWAQSTQPTDRSRNTGLSEIIQKK
jgi:hypothetical protein